MNKSEQLINNDKKLINKSLQKSQENNVSSTNKINNSNITQCIHKFIVNITNDPCNYIERCCKFCNVNIKDTYT
jgi:hypothetical protein